MREPTKQREENHEQGCDLYNSPASNARHCQQACILTLKATKAGYLKAFGLLTEIIN
jgi:hypothetical protein